MPPKSTKEMEEALQAIPDKLANLQDALHTIQANQLAFQRDLESRQSIFFF